MVLTKPEPKEHYDAMTIVAQNVVDQEMASDNVKKTIAQMGADRGLNLPVTLGLMGKVFILVDEEQVKQMLRQ